MGKGHIIMRIKCLAVFLATAAPVWAQTVPGVWFVSKANTSGVEDGLSWQSAFTTLQPAIDAAHYYGGGEVWVAKGLYDEMRESKGPYNYRPSSDWGNAFLVIREGVGVYGGFEGHERRRSLADFRSFASIIDGWKADNGAPTPLVVHMDYGSTLQGFRVTGPTRAIVGAENAVFDCIFEDFFWTAVQCAVVERCIFRRNGNPNHPRGAVWGASVVRASLFENNVALSGAAITQWSNLIVEDCVFIGNEASSGAIAIYNTHGILNVDSAGISYYNNNVFVGNRAVGLHGLPIILSGSGHVIAHNCLFYDNDGRNSVWRIFSPGGNTVGHLTIVNNTVGSNAAVQLYTDKQNAPISTIHNSILWNPGAPREIEGRRTNDPVHAAGSVIRLRDGAIQPTFVDAANGDFRLAPGSSAIDAGVVYDRLPPKDFAGEWRFQGSAPDAGAFESPGFIVDTNQDGTPDFAADYALPYVDPSLDFAPIDLDGDGLPDEWEVAHGFDPRRDNAGIDRSGNGLTNRQEFLLGTDPRNANDPPRSYYVEVDGSDASGWGTRLNPWRSLTHAIAQVRLLALFRATNIYAGPGVFTEKVVLDRGIAVFGEGPELTTIQYFNPAETEHGVVIGYEGSSIRGLTVTVPQSQAAVINLIQARNASMLIERVVIDGKFSPFATGITLSGPGNAETIVRQSVVRRTHHGLWAVDAPALIGLTVFHQIGGNAVFVQPLLKGAGAVPVLGRADGLDVAGLNRFVDVEGRIVRNVADVSIEAHYNDWGAYTHGSVMERMSGGVDVDRFFQAPLDPVTAFVMLRDGLTGSPIVSGDAAIEWVGDSHDLLYDEDGGLYLITGLAPGHYEFEVHVPEYSATAAQITASAGPTDSLVLVDVPLWDMTAFDVDGNGVLDASDIQYVINAALGTPTPGVNPDINGDGLVDALDIQFVINAVLGAIGA